MYVTNSSRMADMPSYMQHQHATYMQLLHATSKKLLGYNADSPLPLLGKFSTTVISKVTDTSADVQFYVVYDGTGNLMSYQTATDPGLLHIVNSVSSSEASNNIIKQYDDRFHGLG